MFPANSIFIVSFVLASARYRGITAAILDRDPLNWA
jgi:hypothetical protein